MDLGTPDRIPLMCQMSIGHMLQQLSIPAVEFWFDAGVYSDGLLKLREIYGFDGILVSLHGHDRNWKNKITSRRAVEGGDEVVLEDNTRMLFSNSELPQVVEQPDAKNFTKEPPGSLKEPLPKAVDYIPVSQGLRFGLDLSNKFESIELLVDKAGQEYSIHGEITSPFDYFLDFVGHQQGLLFLIVEPERSKTLLNYFTTLLEELAAEMCGTGVDAIKISSPFAGSGFISPEFYSEYVAPFDGRLARTIRSKGLHAYIHTCGAIGDRLQTMLELGASGIECLDPPPLGNVELETAINLARGKGFIKGNIDSVNILLRGTDEEILSDARARLEIGKKSGGFILSTACSIAPMVKREKVRLLREAVTRWG